MYVTKDIITESEYVMNSIVDDYVDVIKTSSKDQVYDSAREFIHKNNLYSRDSMQVLVDELNNRLEAKEKASTVIGGILLPVAFGYLVFLLENDVINSSPGYFGIAILLMTLLMSIAVGVANWLVGKKGVIWKIRLAVSVLHQLQLEKLSCNENTDE